MSKIEQVASSHCPICTQDTPHHHSRLSGIGGPKKWIGVDFDGTLAFDAFDRTDPYQVGEPIPEMVNRVKWWVMQGFDVRILTARMSPISYTAGGVQRDLVKMESVLRNWSLEHIGIGLGVTCQKDGLMEVLWDDRAVMVIKDTGMPSHVFTADHLQAIAEATAAKDAEIQAWKDKYNELYSTTKER